MKRMHWFSAVCIAVILGVVPGSLLAQTKSAASKPSAKTANAKPAASRVDDEQALRKSAADFAKFYNAADAKGIAAQFLPQAEMVDLDGNFTLGREAIEKAFADHFVEPMLKVAVEIESLRFVSNSLAIEDGHLTFTNEDDEVTIRSRYTVVHVKEAGEWMVASSRDVVNPNDRVAAHEHLKQLGWLVGDWVEEGGHSIVATSCRWEESKNYLLSEYTVKVAGQATMSGTQRIGWDPLTRQIKTWTFDSDGGYGEGYWHRDGDRWVVKLHGVSADGRVGSMTQYHEQVNDHTRTWSASDRILGGEHLDDIDEITVVRAAPKPKQTAAKKATPN